MRTAPENEAKIVKGNKCPHNCHTTPPGDRKGESVVGRENRSENVTFVTFVGFWCFIIIIFLNHKAFENQWSYSPPCPSTLAPFPICWVSSLEAGFSIEGQTAKGDKWPPLEAVPMSGKGDPSHPRPRPVWFFKAATPGLSNHTFWASIRNCYISVFPSCYGLSRFRDQLRITAKRLSQQKAQAGEVHNASTLALTHSSGGTIK